MSTATATVTTSHSKIVSRRSCEPAAQPGRSASGSLRTLWRSALTTPPVQTVAAYGPTGQTLWLGTHSAPAPLSADVVAEAWSTPRW